MAAPRKYPDELRERATRLAVDARRDPSSAAGAIKRIADQLGIHPEALRTWVKQAETDAGDRAGTTSGDAARIAELERENRELRRANQILKSAASFFAAELAIRWSARSLWCGSRSATSAEVVYKIASA
ncbi:transposase [Pseudonocardia zijingensis]|uniref:Transposase n=1 Tax=Pseudonocardia zijingensis TaxID=153376 RepID=A0ABN1NKE5_9PSEU